MRTVRSLAAGDGFAVQHVRIWAETGAWTAPEPPSGYRLVLVRDGLFRARVGDHALLADPAFAYIAGPADAHSIAHHVGRTDSCTVLLLSAGFMAELTGRAPPRPAVPVPGRLAVAHRLLAARARQGVAAPDLTELTARLVGGLLTDTAPASAPPGRATTVAARRRLAETAREVVNAGPGVPGLRTIARAAGCSPHHLSRVFHRETGMTLTRYGNRVRVLRALAAIEAGRSDLAGLAADLGFADHAHMTRTVRRECGRPPRALRRLLAAAN